MDISSSRIDLPIKLQPNLNEIRKLKVLMLPWLAHGHVNPFVELAKQLTKTNFQVYIYTTPVILESIKEKIIDDSIETIELHLPPNPNLPPNLHTTKGLPLELQPFLIQSFRSCGPNFSTILNDIRPDLVLYDIFCQWVPPLASTLGIPAVFTITTSAAAISKGLLFKRQGKQGEEEFHFPDIYLAGPYNNDNADLIFSTSDRQAQLENFSKLFDLSCSILLVKGCNMIEEKYFNYLSELTGKEVVAMGPLVHPPNPPLPTNANEQKILGWLDSKEPFSTVLISFGSESYMDNKDEVEELAYGLELSNVNFIWVVRFPSVAYDKKKPMSVEEAMPSGILKRVAANGSGLFVDGWAPQTGILSHGNLGGFVSHCGWGSTMESMYFGVPIIAMPKLYDQPIVARFVEEVGVGLEVLRDKNGKYKSSEVAKAINEVLGTRGDEFRRKAKDVSHKLRKEGDDAAIAVAQQVSKLCHRNL